jgi:hypothetical protein
MTERADQLLIQAFSKPPPQSFGDLQAWREYRDDLSGALKLLDKRLEDSDREEYEALQKRMLALQARIGGPVTEFSQPKPNSVSEAPPAAKRRPWKCGACERTTEEEVCPRCREMTAPPSYAETDAGRGVGGGREAPMTTGEFRDELLGLRDRTTEKRARSGL